MQATRGQDKDGVNKIMIGGTEKEHHELTKILETPSSGRTDTDESNVRLAKKCKSSTKSTGTLQLEEVSSSWVHSFLLGEALQFKNWAGFSRHDNDKADKKIWKTRNNFVQQQITQTSEI